MRAGQQSDTTCARGSATTIGGDMRYLEQLSDTQVAFSVRQKRPKTLAEAVALTQETESLAIASDQACLHAKRG